MTCDGCLHQHLHQSTRIIMQTTLAKNLDRPKDLASVNRSSFLPRTAESKPYRFVMHDRDAVLAAAVDDALRSMHLRVLKTPVRIPHENA